MAGQPFGIDLLTFPVQSEALRKMCAKNDYCPECSGELDTGFECNECGFDARELAYPEFEREMDEKWGSV